MSTKTKPIIIALIKTILAIVFTTGLIILFVVYHIIPIILFFGAICVAIFIAIFNEFRYPTTYYEGTDDDE